jgi:hypothetical protein
MALRWLDLRSQVGGMMLQAFAASLGITSLGLSEHLDTVTSVGVGLFLGTILNSFIALRLRRELGMMQDLELKALASGSTFDRELAVALADPARKRASGRLHAIARLRRKCERNGRRAIRDLENSW